MKILLQLIALLSALFLTGCAALGWKYGDGKLGPIPLGPAAEAAADAADKVSPGIGAQIRAWKADAVSPGDRVPAGWRIRWVVYDMENNIVDISQFHREPILEQVANVTNAVTVGEVPQ